MSQQLATVEPRGNGFVLTSRIHASVDRRVLLAYLAGQLMEALEQAIQPGCGEVRVIVETEEQ